MRKKIAIIGGGVIGLCSAYYLSNSGHEVIVLDKSNMDSGASYVNAGYLSPSHIIPLAAPGVMKKGIKWMFDNSSPLYIKPRFNMDLIKWGLAFNRSCNPRHVERSVPVIKDIAIFSQQLYDDLKNTEDFNFHYEKKGLLTICNSEKGMVEESNIGKLAKEHGLEVYELNAEELKKEEPNVRINALGAIFYKCDFHTTPQEFMTDMKNALTKKGVEIKKSVEVKGFEFSGEKINKIKTAQEEIEVDEVVLAAGSWSPQLSKQLNLKLLLQAGKGYRINSTRDFGIGLPAILSERKIAITPMNGFTRFAGTMEIVGIDHSINKVRVDAIATGVKDYYPEVIISEEEKAKAASGLRPVTPDGLPYIGKTSKCTNLTLGTGHAMMGWSMATATGKLVQEIIDEEKPSLELGPFNPERRF